MTAVHKCYYYTDGHHIMNGCWSSWHRILPVAVDGNVGLETPAELLAAEDDWLNGFKGSRKAERRPAAPGPVSSPSDILCRWRWSRDDDGSVFDWDEVTPAGTLWRGRPDCARLAPLPPVNSRRLKQWCQTKPESQGRGRGQNHAVKAETKARRMSLRSRPTV